MTEPSTEPSAPADDPVTELRAVLDGAAEGIARPSAPAEGAAREQVGLGTPEASRLGRLAEWAIWLSGVQDGFPPHPLDRVQLLVAGPRTAPADDASSRLAGMSSGVTVKPVALQSDWALSTTADAAAAAIDATIDAGCDLLICTASVPAAHSSTLVAILLRLSATEVVGSSDHLDDDAWAALVADVRDRSRSLRGLEDDPVAILQALGSPELVALVAMLLRAAARRTPVLLDGSADAAAALCAARHSILSSWWRLSAATSSDPATTRAIDALGLEPILTVDSRLEGGAAALTALPLLRAAQGFVAPG